MSICEKAPEPSSLSLLGLGALVMLFMKRKRSWWVGF
ncbi:MAG: PEP-CTERM sorting domain-containing protein [Actinobacteria bacterium]|nr:PEP-CTERM sorting domain-containing protein [Actinomycetota bacterium]